MPKIKAKKVPRVKRSMLTKGEQGEGEKLEGRMDRLWMKMERWVDVLMC